MKGINSQISRLMLVDGYTTTINNTDVVYRDIELRETTVADEDAAIEAATSPVQTREGWKLLLNEDLYRRHLVLRAIKNMHCEGHNPIPGHVLQQGKFSTWDWYAIESRLVLVEMAGQLRHGQIDQDTFNKAIISALGEHQLQEKPVSRGRSDSQTARSSDDYRQAGAVEPLE